MANLVGIFDSKSIIRSDFIASCETGLPAFDTVNKGALDQGSLSLAWAACRNAPISRAVLENGSFCFVVGEFTHNTASPDEAAALIKLSEGVGPLCVSGQNGYYLSVLSEADGKVYIGTDTLGLFPLFYWSNNDTLLFSTSPGLLKRFQGLQAKPDPHGIAGILLTMHITRGRTVWEGVHRLKPGHALAFHPGSGSREIKAGLLENTDRHFGKTFAECQRLCHETLETVASRATANQFSMLLSGGLDSRLISGYLSRAGQSNITALTVGLDTDYEMQCASPVAKALRWPQRKVRDTQSSFCDYARIQIDNEQMSHSFVELSFWQAAHALREMSGPVVTGYLGDPVLGFTHVPFGYDDTLDTHTFEQHFQEMNRYGFTPDQLRVLLRPEFAGECVTETIHAMRHEYQSIEGLPFQKSWKFDLLYRQRLHVAPFAWRMSLGAWPRLPYTDRDLLEVAAGMAPAALGDRRVQIALLCQRFRQLAELPLDRNSENIEPLIATLGYRIRRKLFPQRLRNQLFGTNAEKRFYFRVFDINNAGWTAVRVYAEQFRPVAETLFKPEALRAFLPPPPTPINLQDGIIDGAARKTLLGLMIWAGRHL